MTWSWGSHLNLLSPPRLSHAEDFRCMEDKYPTLYHVFLTVINYFNNQTHPVHNPSVSFTVACLESSLWTIYASHGFFFQPELGKDWLFSYIISLQQFWLVFGLLFVSTTTAIYPLLLPLQQLLLLLLKSSVWYPKWWNLHYLPKKDCLHIQMILRHPWYRTHSLDAGFCPW